MFKPHDRVRVTHTALTGAVTVVNDAGWFTVRHDDGTVETWPAHRLQALVPLPWPAPAADAVLR